MSATDPHAHVAELLPWYVNGTLGSAEHDAVAAHLSGCPACREEAAQCESLAAAVRRAPDAAGAADAGRLERLLAGIELIEAAGAGRVGWRGQWRAGVQWLADLLRHTPGPIRVGLAAQAALLVLVVGLATWPAIVSTRAPYRTLADDADRRTGEVQVHVVFAEDITERELRTLLGRIHARIADGPSGAGVYTLAIEGSLPGGAAPIIDILRGDPKVQLAEPASRR
jgi:anti-sigma factor RsiW